MDQKKIYVEAGDNCWREAGALSSEAYGELLRDMSSQAARVTFCSFLCGIGIGSCVAALIIGGLWL